MDLYFLQHGEYERLYNCTGIDAWNVGTPNLPLGVAYLTVGITLEVSYIPCMIVLLKPEHRQNSCYKLMFLLGLFDMVTLSINAILTGYFTIYGIVFCCYPLFIYFCGVAVLGLWCGTCFTSVILGINRACDLWFPNATRILFGGARAYLWYLPPIIYCFCIGLESKVFLFSTRGYAWYISPYADIEELNYKQYEYHSGLHTFNNFAVMILTSLIYIILIISVWYKSRDMNSQQITKIQKQLIFQSYAICFFIIVADSIYVYAQYYSAPPFLVTIGQWCWIACHGSAVVIYLTCNKTIKGDVFKLLGLKKVHEMFSKRTKTQVAENTQIAQMNRTTRVASPLGRSSGDPRELLLAVARLLGIDLYTAFVYVPLVQDNRLQNGQPDAGTIYVYLVSVRLWRPLKPPSESSYQMASYIHLNRLLLKGYFSSGLGLNPSDFDLSCRWWLCIVRYGEQKAENTDTKPDRAQADKEQALTIRTRNIENPSHFHRDGHAPSPSRSHTALKLTRQQVLVIRTRNILNPSRVHRDGHAPSPSRSHARLSDSIEIAQTRIESLMMPEERIAKYGRNFETTRSLFGAFGVNGMGDCSAMVISSKCSGFLKVQRAQVQFLKSTRA
uniref:G protein-coupled receptor n=2 Tax=Steinernema glaseri TaxID=37863 RepID=A0A1I7YYF4_9BILA